MNKMKKINPYTVQIVFVLFLAASNFIGNSAFEGYIYTWTMGCINTLIIIYFIFKSDNINSSENSKKVKKQLLYAFIAIQLFLILISYVAKCLGNMSNIGKVLINIADVTSFIVILKLFKIEKNQFNYKLDKNMIIISSAIGCTYLLANILYSQISGEAEPHNNIIFDMLRYFIVVAFIEETAFRGLLLDFLKSCNMPFYSANIIQSILFAAAHIANNPAINYMTILSLSSQALFGLLAGYLVNQKKSLMPAMIIHTINNVLC